MGFGEAHLHLVQHEARDVGQVQVRGVVEADPGELVELAAVCLALRSIEDLRDRNDFDANVDLVAGALTEMRTA